MNVGVLGSGDVAKVLAGGFLKHGHTIMLGTRSKGKLADWIQQNPKSHVGTFAEAAAFAELIVLAVKGTAAAEALHSAGTSNLTGKIIIDATNPIADAQPVNGVLRFFTNLDEALMERRSFERRRSLASADLRAHRRGAEKRPAMSILRSQYPQPPPAPASDSRASGAAALSYSTIPA